MKHSLVSYLDTPGSPTQEIGLMEWDDQEVSKDFDNDRECIANEVKFFLTKNYSGRIVVFDVTDPNHRRIEKTITVSLS